MTSPPLLALMERERPAHNPGGRSLPLPAGVVASAVYAGPGHCYRHRLDWRWADGPALLFLGMNPSTASHLAGDATVCKVKRLASRWGFGRLLVGNTFAYRATDQARLAEVSDPVGPDNDRHVLDMASEAALILIGYGTPKVRALRDRGPELCRKLVAAGHELTALRVSEGGSRPHHPLYLPERLNPTPWVPA